MRELTDKLMGARIMHFCLLTIGLLLLSNFAFSQGRKPAVEDFVGIEVEQPESPPGSETLYNLEQDMNKVQLSHDAPPKMQLNKLNPPQESNFGIASFFVVLLVMGLPLVSWLFVMNRLRHKATEESQSNIKVLESYRKNREQLKKSEDKKAS